MPFKVQSHLPSIGLELYQMGVHILAKKKKKFLIVFTKLSEQNLNTRTKPGVGPIKVT